MKNVYVDIREENEYIRDYFKDKDFVSINRLLNAIDNLGSEVEHWKEQYDDLMKDLKENYKPISKWEELGISESDFH